MALRPCWVCGIISLDWAPPYGEKKRGGREREREKRERERESLLACYTDISQIRTTEVHQTIIAPHFFLLDGRGEDTDVNGERVESRQRV